MKFDLNLIITGIFFLNLVENVGIWLDRIGKMLTGLKRMFIYFIIVTYLSFNEFR